MGRLLEEVKRKHLQKTPDERGSVGRRDGTVLLLIGEILIDELPECIEAPRRERQEIWQPRQMEEELDPSVDPAMGLAPPQADRDAFPEDPS